MFRISFYIWIIILLTGVSRWCITVQSLEWLWGISGDALPILTWVSSGVGGWGFSVFLPWCVLCSVLLPPRVCPAPATATTKKIKQFGECLWSFFVYALLTFYRVIHRMSVDVSRSYESCLAVHVQLICDQGRLIDSGVTEEWYKNNSLKITIGKFSSQQISRHALHHLDSWARSHHTRELCSC